MIRGYAYDPASATSPIESVDDVKTAWVKADAFVWVDVYQPTEPEMAALGQLFNLDESSLDDCLRGEQRPRIDEFDGHLFIMLYGMVGIDDPQDISPRKLAAFCGDRFLITVHHERLVTVEAVFERCAKNGRVTLAKGVDSILYHIVDGMVDKYLIIVDQYETKLESLEDDSLYPDVDETLLTSSAELRRDLLAMRSLAVSQMEFLMPLSRGECDFISESLELRFRHVRDHLAQVIDGIDMLREQLRSVRENYHTALANRTNAIMKTLTIFATILLPLTFVAGLYGMNLPLWPDPSKPLSFWLVIGAMGVIAAAMFYFFRRRSWL